MLFRFVASDKNNKAIYGEISSDSKSEAERSLKDQGLTVNFIQAYNEKDPKNKSKFEQLINSFRRNNVVPCCKHELFEQLSMLLGAGLPIEQCLSSLSIKTKKRSNGTEIVEKLREKILSGMSLSEAMLCCNNFFSETEIKTVKSAEKIGQPAAALSKLSEFGKSIQNIKRKIKSALTYPAFVLVVSIIALTFLMTIVVPKFEAIFLNQRSSGSQLPWLTQKVIGACNFIGSHTALAAITIAIIFVAVKTLLTKKTFREKALQLASKLPFFRKLLLSINLNNFSRTIGMLMSFGVSLQEAFKLSIDVISNNELRIAFKNIFNRISHGEPLSDSFKNNKFMCSSDFGLISAGEQSGELANAFNKISELYERKIESQLMAMTTLIEPIIIVVLAIVVGIIAVSMFLPMINLMQNIKM